MKIKRHRPYGSWIWGEYNIYVNNKLVAKIRKPLVGMDHTYVYFLPTIYGDNNCTTIDSRYLVESEVLEKAVNIVRKKLYLLATNIISDMRVSVIEE